MSWLKIKNKVLLLHFTLYPKSRLKIFFLSHRVVEVRQRPKTTSSASQNLPGLDYITNI